MENGLLVLVKSNRLTCDLWIDWQRFILPRSTYQEEFTVGKSNRVSLLNSALRWSLTLPVQGILFHKGGQINDQDGVYTHTILNSALGLGLGKRIPSRFIERINWDNFIVTYNKFGRSRLAYTSGLGYYTTFNMSSRLGSVQAGYWNGEKFYAPLGEPLYQSISWRKEGVTVRHREILFGKVIFYYFVEKGICMDFRLEGYFYPRRVHMDYAYGLTLTINKEFFLKRVEPRPDLN